MSTDFGYRGIISDIYFTGISTITDKYNATIIQLDEPTRVRLSGSNLGQPITIYGLTEYGYAPVTGTISGITINGSFTCEAVAVNPLANTFSWDGNVTPGYGTTTIVPAGSIYFKLPGLMYAGNTYTQGIVKDFDYE